MRLRLNVSCVTEESRSFETQRINRIELGGLARGIKSKEHPDRSAEEERDQDGIEGNYGRPFLHRGGDGRAADANRNPDESAQATQGECFDDELP